MVREEMRSEYMQTANRPEGRVEVFRGKQRLTSEAGVAVCYRQGAGKGD